MIPGNDASYLKIVHQVDGVEVDITPVAEAPAAEVQEEKAPATPPKKK